VDDYGLETRIKDPIRNQVRNVSSGLLVYDQLDHRRQQETVSFRSPVRGSPYLGSLIDPYYDGLVHVDSNKSFKSKLETPIVVDGKVISYYSNRDNGHSFLTREGVIFTTCNHGSFYNSNAQWVYGGPIYAGGAQVAPAQRYRMPFWVDGDSATSMHRLPYVGSPGDLATYGKKALEILIPGIPKTSAFVATGELFLGWPKFIGHSFERLGTIPELLVKHSSEEFLNFVFGIVPTVQDLQGLVSQLSSATKTLLQLERDSGLGVRRNMKFDIPDALAQFNSSELSQQGYLTANMMGYNPSYTGSSQADVGNYYGLQTSLTMRQARSVSFSGSFTRVMPVHRDLENSYVRFMGLYSKYIIGADVTLDRIWQLIPFSWLVDWFLNIRKSLDLYEKVKDDSLVINYGYIMGKTVQTVIQETKVTANIGATSIKSVRSVYLSTRVERLRANPYGFILPTNVALNPQQWAILAALGITRKSVN